MKVFALWAVLIVLSWALAWGILLGAIWIAGHVL